jgi:hypothetical protein
MDKIAWFTSVNIKYLDRAAILVDSMKAIHPDWSSVLLLVDGHNSLIDEVISLFDYVLYPEDVVSEDPNSWLKIRSRDLASNSVSNWLAQHSVTEACTAVKPFAMKYLSKDYDYVFYLDPDIVVFNELSEVLKPLKMGSSIVLTPHQLEPESDWQAIVDNEFGSLRTGIYNFGFLGINCKHDEAIKFVDFWLERMKYFCLEESKDGLFTDQKWGNLAPIYFKDTYITQHPGLNVASWNLSKRDFSVDLAGNYQVNGQPLIFYHFSQARGAGLVMARRYSNQNPLVADMWRWYLEQLDKYQEKVPTLKWKYQI